MRLRDIWYKAKLIKYVKLRLCCISGPWNVVSWLLLIGTHELCEILKAFKIIKNKNAEMTSFSEPVLLYTAFISQTAKK
jgi:hypothetical protein